MPPTLAPPVNKENKKQQPNQPSAKIANSKLLALLSKLDKGRGDYGYTRQKRAMRENLRNRQDIVDMSPGLIIGQQHSPQVINQRDQVLCNWFHIKTLILGEIAARKFRMKS